MDVDIDLRTTFEPLEHFSQAVQASVHRDGKLTKHPAGVYFQSIPKDPITNLSAVPHKHAEELGFFKIDMLSLSAIDDFSKFIKSKKEIRELLDVDPNWDLLLNETVVAKLMQVHRYHSMLVRIKPHSVEMLADTIALIRPAKRALVTSYVKCTTEKERDELRSILYAKPDDGAYYYKKPHAVAYAMTIVLQLHLIDMGLL